MIVNQRLRSIKMESLCHQWWINQKSNLCKHLKCKVRIKVKAAIMRIVLWLILIKTILAFQSHLHRKLHLNLLKTHHTCHTLHRSQATNMLCLQLKRNPSYQCMIHQTSYTLFNEDFRTLSIYLNSSRKGLSTRAIVFHSCQRKGYMEILTTSSFRSDDLS